MIIPVRCFTCGKVISDVYEEFVKRYDDYKKALDAGRHPRKHPKRFLII